MRPDVETATLYHAIKTAAHEPPPAQPATAALDTRPGLAVLPLRMLNGDQTDSDFADALTEELIATLAAYRWFFVISALQASVYRGRSVEPKQLAAELGVRYVLSGAARRSATATSCPSA